VGAPTIVHATERDQGPTDTRIPTLVGWSLLGLLGAVGMVVTGTRIGSVPDPAAGHWWFSLPSGGAPLTSVGFYLAAVLFVVAWVGIGVQALAGRLTIGWAWAILGMWGVPLFLGPPLFSRDLYSYVAQGLIAHRGLNPYHVGPNVLGPGPLLSGVASVWRATPSPYGPLFVTLSRWTADLTGSGGVAGVLAYRVLALVGVVLCMVCLPRLARRLGTDPGMALWLGALSPLALFGFVASGHNDALMVGLLVAGVTLALEGRLLLGLALCALAATIKLPAAVAVVFLLVDHVRTTGLPVRWRAWLAPVLVPVAVFVGVTVACGYGWTWLGPTALHIPTELRVLTTPAVSVGVLVYHLFHLIGLPVAQHSTVSAVQALFGLAAVACCAWLLVTVRRHDLVRSLGLALLLVVVGSPTVWPWYLMWGVVLLAASSAQRSKLLAAVAGLAMLVVGPSGSPRLLGNSYLVVTLVTAAFVVWVVRDGRWRRMVALHAA
jgi:alpha-1,6-mannosyltransferase